MHVLEYTTPPSVTCTVPHSQSPFDQCQGRRLSQSLQLEHEVHSTLLEIHYGPFYVGHKTLKIPTKFILLLGA